ncbi:MAG: glycosyltransferase family 2 protein [Nanoarchaeota archaeon]
MVAFKRVSLVIPCYNEEDSILNLTNRLNPAVADLEKDYEIELVFVDDGSKDKTYQLLNEHYGNKKDVKIIRHEQNYNLGAALRTAFRSSTGEVIVPLDCDCTFPPEKVRNLLELLDDDIDIVNASPYHPLGKLDNVPFYRRILSKTISETYRTLLGRKDIYTYTGIFRAYRKNVLDNIKFESDGFLCCAEILSYAILKGYKIKEYPSTLYTRQYGKSSIKLFRVIMSHLKFVVKLSYIKLLRRKKI